MNVVDSSVPDPGDSRKSSRPNALKHGLTAWRYVSPEQTERVEAVRAELVNCHRPQSTEEWDLIDQIALARVRLYDAEASHDARVRYEKLNAEELYNRRQRDRFVSDLKAWREDPFASSLVFGTTLLSATYLSDIWGAADDGLASGCGITYEQIKELLTAEGANWRVGRLDVRSGRLMSLFLSLQEDAEPAIERWVADSRAGVRAPGPIEEDLDRAHWFLAAAPEAEEAHAELAARTREKSDYWTSQAAMLQHFYQKGRGMAAEMAMGLGADDPDSAKEARLAFRYLISATNRAEKLERRLEALKKMRPLNALRASRQDPAALSTTTARAPDTEPEPVQQRPSQVVDSLHVAAALRNEEKDGAGDDIETGTASRRPDPAKVVHMFREKEKQAAAGASCVSGG
jgi:hypothetical protein